MKRTALWIVACLEAVAPLGLLGSAEVSESGRLGITVRDLTGSSVRPVTGGVPLPRGSAPPGTRFSLATTRGDRIPLQAKVLARWKDGSARWVLLDFQAAPPPNGTAGFLLEWSQEARGPEPTHAVKSLDPAGQSIGTGELTVAVSKSGVLDLAGARRLRAAALESLESVRRVVDLEEADSRSGARLSRCLAADAVRVDCVPRSELEVECADSVHGTSLRIDEDVRFEKDPGEAGEE